MLGDHAQDECLPECEYPHRHQRGDPVVALGDAVLAPRLPLATLGLAETFKLTFNVLSP